MSRLIAAIELSVNGISHGNSKSCLLAGNRLRNITAVDPSGCEVGYFQSFGADITTLRVGESVATMLSRQVATNTTNMADLDISLTQIFPDATTKAIKVNTADILHVYFYPGEPNDSLVVMQDATRTSIINIRVDETKTAIQALANA